MTIEEYRTKISYCYNLPLLLVTGNTAEEIENHARDLCAFRDSINEESNQGKTPREQFGAWLSDVYGIGAAQDEPEPAPVPNYPNVKDFGETHSIYSPSPLEQFRDWFYNKSAYDPTVSGGWKRYN